MKDIQFLPIATVEVTDDGTLTLVMDWSSSAEGEWDGEAATHQHTPLSAEVGAALEAWIAEQPERIVIGKVEVQS